MDPCSSSQDPGDPATSLQELGSTPGALVIGPSIGATYFIMKYKHQSVWSLHVCH